MSAVLSQPAPQRIDLRLDEYKANSYLTHNLHPYPAKYIPQIPREIIEKLTARGDWVLDPFCGSGTTLVECTLIGRNSTGTDINPLSCLISRAKSTRLTSSQLRLLEDFGDLVARTEHTPRSLTKLPTFFGIDKWFERHVQLELATLLAQIRSVDDECVRTFLEVVFSAIVVRVSNQESDTRYKAISKDLPAGVVRQVFLAKLKDAAARAGAFSDAAQDVSAKVWRLDSTREVAPSERKYKLAVTSPPYMNSYDYYLYHKHRMNWLGLDVSGTQEHEFGSRNKHNDKGLGINAYNEPIARSIALTRSLLADDGYYCAVVGDAIWKGQLIKMNENYDQLFAAAGYRKVREIVFPQRKYTRTFTMNLRTQHKDSYVLIYARE